MCFTVDQHKDLSKLLSLETCLPGETEAPVYGEKHVMAEIRL